MLCTRGYLANQRRVLLFHSTYHCCAMSGLARRCHRLQDAEVHSKLFDATQTVARCSQRARLVIFCPPFPLVKTSGAHVCWNFVAKSHTKLYNVKTTSTPWCRNTIAQVRYGGETTLRMSAMVQEHYCACTPRCRNTIAHVRYGAETTLHMYAMGITTLAHHWRFSWLLSASDFDSECVIL